MANRRDRISPAVIRRLPRYYRQLTDLMNMGIERISSGDLGESMGLTASQIRQDYSCFGEFGQQGYGYNVVRLRAELATILGMEQKHTAIVIGVGNLGRALMENFHFESYGVVLAAGFDLSPALHGKIFGSVEVLPLERLKSFVKENPVSIAVLAVPQVVAQPLTETLSKLGIRGLWNFTNVEVKPCEGETMIVENVHFSDSLLALSYMISEEGEGAK